MSLRAFLYGCETLRLQSEDRFHVETPVAPEPTPQDMRERNAQAMQMMQGILGGVQGAPRVGR